MQSLGEKSVANGHRKRANQSQNEGFEGWREFCREKVLWFQTVASRSSTTGPRALRRGRVSNGESVRGGQPGPGIWHQRLLSDRAAALYFILSQHWNSVGTAAFFLTFLWQPPCHAVGWIVLRYLLLRRQDDSRQKDSLIDLSHYFPIQFHLC